MIEAAVAKIKLIWLCKKKSIETWFYLHLILRHEYFKQHIIYEMSHSKNVADRQMNIQMDWQTKGKWSLCVSLHTLMTQKRPMNEHLMSYLSKTSHDMEEMNLSTCLTILFKDIFIMLTI